MDMSMYEWVFNIDGEEDLEQAGCVCLGEGSSRTVYAIDNEVVVKIAKEEIGERQNLTEWKVYDQANEDQRELLAPAYELGQGNNSLLLMRRAETRVPKVPDYWMLDSLIDDFNLLQEDLNNISSWGEIEGEIVCIDYGCDHETRNEYDDTILRDSLLENY